jgi:MoxR-like ATPase
LKKLVQWGAGPRAIQYLVKGAKARAVLAGNFMTSMEDVEKVAVPVLSHRILTNFHARSEGMNSTEVVARLIEDARKEQR